jgi:hypothetical protein
MSFCGLLHEHAVNAVLLTAKHTYFGQVEKVIAACELEGVEVWLMANFFQTGFRRRWWMISRAGRCWCSAARRTRVGRRCEAVARFHWGVGAAPGFLARDVLAAF